jgi:uncharacterized membrane protein YoaK (UPF0700 family)
MEKTGSAGERMRAPRVLLVLTFVTGMVDAVSLLALGRVFTANLTGNVVFIGLALAGMPEFSLSRSLTALVGFLAGAVLGGRLAESMSQRFPVRWVRTAWSSEAGLLFLAALVFYRLERSTIASHVLDYRSYGRRNGPSECDGAMPGSA